MAKRWKQRPDGSTWGDWGDDDELGRINLLTPEKVLQGVREVQAGITFCLSLPLDFPGGTVLNQRRHPPRLAPTEDMEGTPDVFYNVHMSEMPDFGDPKYVDVWADDVVTLSLQYSTQWDSLAHVGAEFDADGDGVEEAVYYNGYRAGTDLVGPSDDAARRRQRPPLLRQAPRPRAHGVPRRAGPRRPRRSRAPPRPRLAGRRPRRRSQEIMAADGVVVEPGDMLLLHTGFATKVLEWDRNPDPRKIFTHVLLPRCARRRRCSSGSPTRRSRRWSPTTTRSRACSARTRTRAATRSCRSTTCACSSSASRSASCGTSTSWPTWLREHGRSRFLLTAPPLRLPGIVGSPLTPIATV